MKDLTPERFRCAVATSCSAVLGKGATLVIIGTRRYAGDRYDDGELDGRIGPDEAAIEISAELVMEALRGRT